VRILRNFFPQFMHVLWFSPICLSGGAEGSIFTFISFDLGKRKIEIIKTDSRRIPNKTSRIEITTLLGITSLPEFSLCPVELEASVKKVEQLTAVWFSHRALTYTV